MLPFTTSWCFPIVIRHLTCIYVISSMTRCYLCFKWTIIFQSDLNKKSILFFFSMELPFPVFIHFTEQICIWNYLSSSWMTSFNISCNTGLLVINSFSFWISEKVFFSLSFLNSRLIAFVFFLSVLQGIALLFSGFSYRKSGVIFIFVPMYITCIFFLVAFKISSLSLFLSTLIMIVSWCSFLYVFLHLGFFELLNLCLYGLH